MKVASVIKAKEEAMRFLQRVEEWEAEHNETHAGCRWVSSSKESGAMRRASMDLTRALSTLRRSDG